MHKLQGLLLIGDSRRNRYWKIQKKRVHKNVYIRSENRQICFYPAFSFLFLFLTFFFLIPILFLFLRTAPPLPPKIATQALTSFPSQFCFSVWGDTHTHTRGRPHQAGQTKSSTFAGTHMDVNGRDGLTHVLCGCSGLKPISEVHTQATWSSPGQPCAVAGPTAALAPDARAHKPLRLRVPLMLFAGPQVSLCCSSSLVWLETA